MRKRELLRRIVALERNQGKLGQLIEQAVATWPVRTCPECRNERSIANMHERPDGTWHCNYGVHLPSKEPFEAPLPRSWSHTMTEPDPSAG